MVQFIKKKVTITAPAGFAAGDKWDCHIFSLPIMTSQVGRPGTIAPGKITLSATNAGSFATVNINKGVTGVGLLPNNVTWAPPLGFASSGYSPCDNANDYSMMRLIGGGFEVHNDTADLYKQGSVTVYAQPTDSQSDFGVIQYSPTSYAASLWDKTRMPPIDIQSATSNVNSVTWSAADGCYVPFQLDTENLHFSQATAIPLISAFADSSLPGFSPTPAWGVETDRASFADASAAVTVGRADQPLRRAGIETTGAYFVGLGYDTVLTLDMRFIVEVAPTPANTTLISLATPSSEYDPEALILYARSVRELPPGVKVTMNAAGDWWRMVSGAINYAAPIVSKFGPYGTAIAGAARGAQMVGDTIQQVRNENKKKKKKAEVPQKGRPGTANSRSGPAPVKGPNPALQAIMSARRANRK